jgi:hypothetical protein
MSIGEEETKGYTEEEDDVDDEVEDIYFGDITPDLVAKARELGHHSDKEWTGGSGVPTLVQPLDEPFSFKYSYKFCLPCLEEKEIHYLPNRSLSTQFMRDAHPTKPSPRPDITVSASVADIHGEATAIDNSWAAPTSDVWNPEEGSMAENQLNILCRIATRLEEDEIIPMVTFKTRYDPKKLPFFSLKKVQPMNKPHDDKYEYRYCRPCLWREILHYLPNQYLSYNFLENIHKSRSTWHVTQQTLRQEPHPTIKAATKEGTTDSHTWIYNPLYGQNSPVYQPTPENMDYEEPCEIQMQMDPEEPFVPEAPPPDV